MEEGKRSWEKKLGKEAGKRRAFDRGPEAEAITVRGHGSIGAAGLIRLRKEGNHGDGGVLDFGCMR